MDQTHLKKIRTSLLVPQQGTISPARLEHILNTMIQEAIRQGAKNSVRVKSGVVANGLVDICIKAGAKAAESYSPARNLPV
ncbi:hypothetical protein LCGC14_2683750 [marine sediment metagenome]|uniref:Uncharacterized protein n=1 Tax=marine sediment metagenome TaxID=412755 RepID=A0A0F9BVE4_9ZZZZ